MADGMSLLQVLLHVSDEPPSLPPIGRRAAAAAAAAAACFGVLSGLLVGAVVVVALAPVFIVIVDEAFRVPRRAQALVDMGLDVVVS